MSDSQPMETKIIYYTSSDDLPTSIRIPIPPDQVTLRDFKTAINIQPSCKHQFLFRNTEEGIGPVRENIVDDDARLPLYKGNIICYINSLDPECICDAGQGTRRGVGESGGGSSHHYHVHPPPSRRYHNRYDYYSDDDTSSRISTSTNETSVSRYNPHNMLRKKVLRKRAASHASSVSSVTDSSASCYLGHAIKTVTLHLDGTSYLGMSLVGNSSNSQNGGIYVGSIMKGGAVAAEGTIQPLDMILQVNDHVLSNMTNDQAVEILREAVQKPGPIKLVVAKNFEPDSESYFTIPREEPIQPLNLEAWINTTEAAIGLNEIISHPSSVSASTSVSHSSMPISEQCQLLPQLQELSLKESEMISIAKYAAIEGSGLAIKDRKWLKIVFQNAFLGRDLVEWLFKNVKGFSRKKDATSYAKEMLERGFIKPTVNKKFSKNCLYVFDDRIFCDTVYSTF